VSSNANFPRFPLYVTGSSEATRALIVVQEGFGVNEHIRDVADRFAAEGFFVVVPHLYHRSGSPEVPYDDVDQAIELMSKVTASGLTNDLNATTNFLLTVGYGPSSVGIVGFCMGGSVSFYAATLATVGAAVSFYGGGVLTSRMGLPSLCELSPALKSPWLGLYGDLDTGIAPEHVEALRAATSLAEVETEIVRYPDAQHGFHCDARPLVYNEQAAHDAYRRTLDFLRDHLVEK
jgi:carboxymethylenebutenolidase